MDTPQLVQVPPENPMVPEAAVVTVLSNVVPWMT